MSQAAPAQSAGTPIASPGGLNHRQILTILSGLLLGMFLAALDQTIVSTSIRTIADDLHGLSQQAWATTAYLITSTISTPLYGKLSDLHGRKPYFLAAISIFIVGSVLCTFSNSMTELAVFRALQGIGAGGLMSLALAIIGDIVPPRERARYQGYMLATFGISSVGGPLIGGFLAGTSSILGVTGWRWVFLVNVPIGIVALFVVAKVLNIPHTRRPSRIDWWGALTLIIGVVPLLLVAEQGRGWGWGSPRSLTCYAIGAVGIVVWIFVERAMGDAALIPMRLFRIPVFSLTSLVGVLIGMGMFGGMLVIPQYLQIVKGASATKSGLEMLPLMAGMMAASIASGQVTSKTGRYKIFPIIGSALMVVAMGLFYFRVDWDTPLWQTMVFMAVFGLGLGGCMQTLVLAVQNAVPIKDMGVATSSSTFFRQMGGTAGTAIFLSVLFSTLSGKIASAFTEAASSASFKAALRDPAVLADPENKPVLSMLKGGSNGGSSSVLSDSSFIQKLDPRLAVPFKAGFADAMHSVFLLAAIVMAVAFVVILFIKEVPLRKISALEARAAEAAGPAPRSEKEPVLVGVGAAESQAEAPSQPPVAAFASPGGGDVQAAGTHAVHGRVRYSDGTPVAAAALTLISPSGRQLGRADARADGGYTLPVPGTGSYVLIAAADGCKPQASTVTVGQEPVSHDVLLSASGGLAGVVTSAPDGLPVEGAMVVVTDIPGNVLASGKTDAAGGFTLGELPVGEYTVAVHASGCRPTARLAEVGGTGTTRLDIVLQAGAQLQGAVRAGADHRPLADARLTLLDAAGNVVGTATSDSEGVYAFTDLDAGGYSLIASGYPPVATTVRVEGRGADGLDLELSHPEK
ncbi:MFS transporter [Streptomyces sp. TS71-3]|uniref:MFS transporter n=1 Tax=Streptomyces sp. TS71-3 TaxID=2733862 RepID=UPI001B1A43B8|nr:MFS transporter [Streptomyces sp. TS71-3]GHJ39764.1 MFS transporter [Streptomyces sp. TS71-3]